MTSKANRKLKIILISFGVILVAVAATALFLMFSAKNAVNDFRVDAAKQLNNVIASKDAGATVELQSVWLGDMLNSDYEKVNSLQNEYSDLLRDLKSYVVVLDAHNQLVAKYNNGLKGEDVVNGDLLKLTSKYHDLVASKFPEDKDRISALDDLTKRITATSDFGTINGFMATVISDNEDWLNGLQTGLNSQIADFQKKIN